MADELNFMRSIVQEAGELLLEHFKRGVVMRQKTDRPSCDLVTEADLAIEKLIVSRIRKAFPSHSILGEEGTCYQNSDSHLWVIDPIDGTTNFAHRVPHFAISIGYYCKGIAEIGVVANPVSGEIFMAIRGSGATLNDQPIEVSKHALNLTQALVATGFYYDRGSMMEQTLGAIHNLFEKNIHGMRRFGAASLDFCYVACGRFDAYFEFSLNPWDFAAGRLIVEEAGGNVSTCNGLELTLTRNSIAASNGILHESLVSTVSPYFAKIVSDI